jgi:tetratricopeptide (TPR) repeat protein
MQKLFFITSFIFILIFNVSADELSEGYKSFINNDRTGAYLHFTAASKMPESKTEALLMLSLISTVDKDASEAFRYFMDFYRSSPDKYAYTQALYNTKAVMGFNPMKSDAQLNWVMEALKQPDLNPGLRAHLMETAGKHFESVYNLKKSREYFSKIGALMEWQIVGDFENISASGFDKDYAPVSHPEPEAVFKNKINADIKWFDLYKQVDGKWIDLLYNFNCTNTLVFAQTFCKSNSDQKIYLRIGTSGSLKVWVNDQLVFREETERNNGIDTYIIPVKIASGNNRILLQIGNSKLEQCNFMMRATDTEGNPLTGLTFSKRYSPYGKTTQEMPVPLVPFAEQFLLGKIKENPEKLVNYLVLATAYLSNDKLYDALGILQKAQALAPDCSYIQDQLFELYLRDQDRTSASLTQEKLKKIDPDNPSVLNYIINDAFNSENYVDARKYIDKKEKLYGKNLELLNYKLKLASQQNKAEEYSALIDEACALYPNDYDIIYDKYKFEKDYKQNQKSAVTVLKNFIKNNYNKSALKTLSAEYIQSGQARNGIELIKQLIEYNPFDDFYYKELGLYYLQAGDYEAAKQNFEESLKIAPYYGPYYGNYARVFEEKGEKENAIRQYELNVIYSPGDYDAIKKIRTLQSKKEVFSWFPEKDYYKLFENSPSAADYPSDNIISLTEERQIVQYGNGGSESRVVMMLKALTLKGIDYLKEYSISYNSGEELIIEKAEVLKKNGNRLQAETNDNNIVYTSLEPGDATFLIYRRNKNITGQMSKQLFEKWMLSNWYPTLNIEYNLLIAKELKLNYDLNNSSVKPEIKDADEFKLYSWKTTVNKSLNRESYMPQMVDVCQLLSISTLPDWDYISKWYYDISNTKTKPDHIVTETVNGLLKGKENLKEYEKALILYNFIEQNIRYSSVSFRQNGIVPQKASEVLVTRIGDCKDLAVLFTSMCNVAGIKAGMVLVIRHQNGTSWMKLPSFDFDHAIAKAILDGKEYYIELTSSYLPFASLDGSLIGAVVLDINNDPEKVSPKILDPTSRKSNNTIRKSEVSFSGDNMTYKIETKRTGSMAGGTRSVYRDQGKEDREKNFTQSLTGTYPNVKLLSLNFNSSLKDCSDTINYNYSFVAPKVFTKINNLSLVKLPLTEQLSAYDFLLEERKYPIEAWRYNTCDTLIEHLTVNFPENKTLVEVPQSVHYSCKQADYTLSFKVLGNQLIVDRKMLYKQNYVPVSDYTPYRAFIESVVGSDTQQIGFK